MCRTRGAWLCLSAMLSNRYGTKQNTKHRKTAKHMHVTCFISISSPEAVQWDEEAAFMGAGVGEEDVGTISGGDLVADSAVAEL